MKRKHLMRALLALMILTLLTTGMALVRLALNAGPEGAELRVVRVVDGDTLIVEMPSGRSERVRLIGVDTPEYAREGRREEFYASEATYCARRLLAGSRVTLESDPLCADRDDYGRLLRYVVLPDGSTLNERVIEDGCGRAFTRFPFTRMIAYRASEEKARRKGLGLWGR